MFTYEARSPIRTFYENRGKYLGLLLGPNPVTILLHITFAIYTSALATWPSLLVKTQSTDSDYQLWTYFPLTFSKHSIYAVFRKRFYYFQNILFSLDAQIVQKIYKTSLYFPMTQHYFLERTLQFKIKIRLDSGRKTSVSVTEFT